MSAVNDAAVVQRTIDGVAQPQQALLLAFQLQFLLNARRLGFMHCNCKIGNAAAKYYGYSTEGKHTPISLVSAGTAGDPANPFYESHHDGRFYLWLAWMSSWMRGCRHGSGPDQDRMEQHALYAQFAILWRKPIFRRCSR